MITLYAPEYATNRPLLANKYRISAAMKGTANATAVHPIFNFRITFICLYSVMGLSSFQVASSLES